MIFRIEREWNAEYEETEATGGNPDAEPQSYWINTSGNELIRRFIDRADKTTRDEIERLIAGESIEKTVRMELVFTRSDVKCLFRSCKSAKILKDGGGAACIRKE